MLSWIDDVQRYILSNYDQNSIPCQIFCQLNRNKLDGWCHKEEMEKQKRIAVSALHACIRLDAQQAHRRNKSVAKCDNNAVPLLLYIFSPHIVALILLFAGVSAWGIYTYCTRENRVYHKALEQYNDKQFSETLAIMQPLSTHFRSKCHVKRVEADCYVNIISNLISKKEYRAALQQIAELPFDVYAQDKFEQLKRDASVAMEAAAKNEAQERETIRNTREQIKEVYRIVATKRHSHRAVDGTFVSCKDYRVVVPAEATNLQLKLIAEAITSSESADINSVLIWFFWPDSDPEGAYSAGMATCGFYGGKWRTKMEYGRTYSEILSVSK